MWLEAVEKAQESCRDVVDSAGHSIESAKSARTALAYSVKLIQVRHAGDGVVRALQLSCPHILQHRLVQGQLRPTASTARFSSAHCMAVLTPPRPDLLAYREADNSGVFQARHGADSDPGQEIDGLHCCGQRHQSSGALDRGLRTVQGS